MPPTIPIFITSLRKPTTSEQGPMLLFHANVFTTGACLKHSHFLKVKVLDHVPHSEVQTLSPGKCREQTVC